MEKAALTYLLDTNILLRLSKRESAEFATIRNALKALSLQNARLCYISQNLIEFWSVATRPVDRNGYGLSTNEVNKAASHIESAFVLLPDTEIIHREWKKLVVKYSVSGTKVHDARIIAAMMVHEVNHILTLNDRDFSRYTDITAVHPADIPVR